MKTINLEGQKARKNKKALRKYAKTQLNGYYTILQVYSLFQFFKKI